MGLIGPARLRPRGGLYPLPLAAGLCLLALAGAMALAAPPTLRATALLAGALVEGVLAAAQIPLLQADLARAVRGPSLAAANSAMEFAAGTGALAGPVLAGLALAGPGLASTLAGCALVMTMAAPAVAAWQGRVGAPPAPAAPARPRAADGVRTAVPYVRRDAFLRTALATRTVNNVLWPVVTVALPLLVARRWHAGALAYGFLLAARGLGSIGGTALAARLGPQALARAYFAAWLVEAAAFVGLALSPLYPPAVACMALAGIASPLVHVALDSRIGRAVADEARGAVFGLQRMAMSAAGLAGSLGAGGAIAFLPVGPVLAGAGVAMAACALGGYAVASRHGGLAPDPLSSAAAAGRGLRR